MKANEQIRDLLKPASVPALLCILSLISIHFSPALSSLSLAASVLMALVVGLFAEKNGFGFPCWIWLFPVYFLLQWSLNLYHTGGIGSDSGFLLRNLPLLCAPLVYSSARKAPGIQFIVPVLLVFLSWLSLAGTLNYFSHRNFYDQMILESKPVPVYSMVYHIEFSMILALASLAGLWFVMKPGRTQRGSFTHWVSIVAVIISVIGLHVFSARTGLLAFYSGLAAMLFSLGVGSRFWRIGAVAAILAVVAFISIPGIKNRIVNTVEDVSAVVQGKDLNNKSFGQRWEAWIMSGRAIMQSPFIGYGWEGARAAVQREFDKSDSGLEAKNRITPHNQYLETALQGGIPALILFLALFVTMVVYAIRNRKSFLLPAIVAVAVAMIFESVMERQAGILYVAVYLPFIAGLDHNRNS